MRPIGGILGRSPFGPTHEHLLKVMECLDLLGPLVMAATAGRFKEARETAARIRRIEEEADRVKNAIRMQFTRSFFASVSRSELMALTKAQDDVADECDRVAYELALRQTRFPDFLSAGALAFIDKIASTRAPLSDVARLLDHSGGGLAPREVDRVRDLLDGAQKLIEEAGPLYDALLHDLFAREKEIEPLDVIFIMRFAEHSDRVASKIENVVDVLTRMVMEKS